MNLDWKIIALFLVGLLMWWFFFLSISQAAGHPRTALSVPLLLVIVFSILTVVCIGCGIYAMVAYANSTTELRILGVRLSTGKVGLAFVGTGLFIGLFTVRIWSRYQRGLARLHPGSERKSSDER